MCTSMSSPVAATLVLASPRGKTIRPRISTLLLRPRKHIHTLPNELLSLIFVFATSDCDADPMPPSHVAQICRRWRVVAFSTGSIWTSITMNFPPRPTQTMRAATSLFRSRSYPLDIVLDFRDPCWTWDDPEAVHPFGWKSMESVMCLLLPHAKRWRSIELLVDTWAPVYTFLTYTSGVTEAPLLEKLSLSRCNAFFASSGEIFQPVELRKPIPLFGGIELPKLREVSLAGVHVDWSASCLRNLVELHFKYHASDVMPSLSEFSQILGDCPDLQRLSILGWGPKLDLDEGEIPGSMAEWLKRQRSIQLPRLTAFSFGFLNAEYAIELLSMLYLPALETLELEDVEGSLSVNPSVNATSILEHMAHSHHARCPSPTHTHECCTTNCIPLSKLKALKLQSIRASPSAFLHFLTQCTTVETLSLFDVDLDVLQALRPATDGVPCPLLSELRVRTIADQRALVDTMLSRATSAKEAHLRKLFIEDDMVLEESFDAEDISSLNAMGVHLFVED